MGLINNTGNTTFLSLSMGKIRKKVDKDTQGSIERENKKTGDKIYELVWDGLSGYLKKIYYKPSKDFGNKLILEIDAEGVLYSLQVSEDSSEFIKILEVLPNIDFNQIILIKPFDFIDKEKNKRVKGVNILQNDEKIQSYYVEKKDGSYNYLFGYPEPKNCNNSDKWKIYFMQCKIFLKDQLEEFLRKEVINNFAIEDGRTELSVDEPEEDNNDLPF